MPDSTITTESINKGKLLELLVLRHLIDIVRNLRKNNVKCFLIYFEDKGGRGRSGTDFFLGIEHRSNSYWYFIEAKNLGERSRSYADIEEKLLKKFKTTSDGLFEKIHNIVIGHFPMTSSNVKLLKSKNINYLDIGELSENYSDDYILEYDGQLRGALLDYIVSTTGDAFSSQASKLELCVLSEHELLLKSNLKIIQKFSVNDMLNKYVILKDSKLLDFFYISKSPYGGLVIKTPWKITAIHPLIPHNSKVGKIMNCAKIMISTKPALEQSLLIQK